MNTTNRLPETGFVRMRGLVAPYGPIPACRATVYAWIRAGIFPAPVAIGRGRIKGFRVEDVRAFLDNPMPSAAQQDSTEAAARLRLGGSNAENC